jgi:D-3-phosphoglycerate dehydrogenase
MHVAHENIVIQSEELSDEAATWLARHCALVACRFDDPAFASVVADAVGLVVRTYTIVDGALLDKAQNLKVVARAGAGLDNIDVEACRRRSIEVVYAPDANTQAVVEYVLCLIGDALRARVTLSAPLPASSWHRVREHATARQMDQLTLGILGLGRVGRRLAQVARAIGFGVIYNDLVEIAPADRAGAEPVELDELCARSDVLSVHIDGRPSNRGFIDARLLARLRRDVVFVNTSRGFIVDSSALAEFLLRCPLAQGMVDVHEPEPFDADYPLLGLPNARLYPHLASRTETALANMSWVVRDVVAVLEGREPRWPAPAWPGAAFRKGV